MTAEFIKQKAKERGATVCGIGNVELLEDWLINRIDWLNNEFN